MKMMKRAVSFIALVAMLVSMFSVCIFPAAAEKMDPEYENYFENAYIVDPDWADMEEGDAITITFQGKEYPWYFEEGRHFGSYSEAVEYVTDPEKKILNPIILLNAGEYTENIEIVSGITLMGSNAGMDPNVKSTKVEDKEKVWTLSPDRSFDDASKETIIKGNIRIRAAAGSSDITLDGFSFAPGSAILDSERDKDASKLGVKNSIFNGAGNNDSYHYGMFLRSDGHHRTLELKNLYITGQNYTITKQDGTSEAALKNNNNPIVGFISPYFVQLDVDNVAYVENKAGFIASSWFAEGVAPVINISNSCFYNASASTPAGHVISIDNMNTGFDFSYAVKVPNPSDVYDTTPPVGSVKNPYYKNKVIDKDVNKRPSSNLVLKDNVFYNASAKSNSLDSTVKGGVIHFQFVNQLCSVNLQGNYFYGPDSTSFMDSEFLVNADAFNQSSCMNIEKNWFIGAYKVPDLTGSHADTYIDLSNNYFARTTGEVVNFPVFSTEYNRRLIRTNFYVDKALTVKNTDWNVTTKDWSLAWVDNSNYDIEIYMYTNGDKSVPLPIKFEAVKEGLTVQLYKNAEMSAVDAVAAPEDIGNKIELPNTDRIVKTVSNPIDAIDASMLNSDLYDRTTLYLQVTDPANPYYAPVYTVTIRNCGDLTTMPEFKTEFPEFMLVHSVANKLNKGDFVPCRWNDVIYKTTVGENLFATPEEAIKAGYKKGIEIPTVCLPAGLYDKEVQLSGSCTLLGEKHGVNPNVVPYEALTKEEFHNSNWTLNPERENEKEETMFSAPIRVVEGADDYVITVDGITMLDGCSYVDDCARNADNITIIKNVFAQDAVGGKDRNGTDNVYLFNFYKSFGPLTDRCTLYLYDARVDGLDGERLLGPYYEKLVVDGLYYAHGKNQSYFFFDMQSRDVPDPYYSLTNGYYRDNNEGQSGMDTFSTHDDKGSQTAKEKIIYNIDNNVFYNAFQDGRASMTFWWSGTNMSVHLFNNTFYSAAGGSFIAATLGGDRFGGDCGESDCSEILLMKGNRFITLCTPPTTAFTGPGTNFDWSGNYWTASLTGDPYTPDNLPITKPTDNLQGHTYEEVTRFTIAYTYGDWDMTERLYAADFEGEKLEEDFAASLDFGKGPKGTASVEEETVGGEKMMVYRDTGISADTTEYPNPATVGVFDTLTYYSDAACTKKIESLNLAGTINVFYGVVLGRGGDTIKFKVEIQRDQGTGADLFYYPGGIVDMDKKTIYVEYATMFRYPAVSAMRLSSGATAAHYTNVSCTTSDKTYINANGERYLKVTSESDHNVFTVYKITFVKLGKNDSSSIGAICGIDGMTSVGNNTYECNVPEGVQSVDVTVQPFFNCTVALKDGEKTIAPKKDTQYTIDVGNKDYYELKVVANNSSGTSSNEYTLKFKRVVNEQLEIYGIEGASLTAENNYSMHIGYNSFVNELKANVAPGVTYAFYEDYACTKKITTPFKVDAESKVLYLKAVSPDGALTRTVRLTIYTLLNDCYISPIVKGTYGSVVKEATLLNATDYMLELPAGTSQVKLSREWKLFAGKDEQGSDTYYEIKEGGGISFYADPQMKAEIKAEDALNLTQKNTKVYYKLERTSYNVSKKQFPDDKKPSSIESVVNERTGVITIVAERSAVSYSDRNAIPSWVTTYVDYLNNNKHGIFMGNENKQLNASANITRNEIATIATRVMGLDTTKFSSVELKFADTVDTWAQPYVRAAVSSGIINGSLDATTGKTYFNGSSYATREQVMKIFVVVCMVNDGIKMDGATYYKQYKNSVDSYYRQFKFADESAVSEWAVPYIHLAVGKYKLVNGTIVNNKRYINPLANITRAEVIKMVACYMGHE